MAFEYEEARFRRGDMPGEDLPQVAVAMLEAGFDTQSIRELAGLVRPTLRDAGELFEAALSSLGRPPLTDRQVLDVLREGLLRQTASGELSAIVGARELWALWHDLGHPQDLSTFVYIEDLWCEYPEQRAALEREIRERAQELLTESRGAAG